MLQSKSIFKFLIKAFLIYGILTIPFPVLEKKYGAFYRSCCKKLFSKFSNNGIARFNETKGKFDTMIQIGNSKQIRKDKTIDMANSPTSIRHRGFIPTMLLISLILASPVSVSRKLRALLAGFFIVTTIIMIQQWIHILHISQSNSVLQITNYSESGEKILNFIYLNFVNYGGPTLLMVISIWILATFRKSDINLIYPKKTA